jgi:hypothetical protein
VVARGRDEKRKIASFDAGGGFGRVPCHLMAPGLPCISPSEREQSKLKCALPA